MRDAFGFPAVVNEKAARVVAGGVVVITATALATGWLWLSAVLAVGFALRVAAGPRYSPLGLLATKVVAPRLGQPRLVPGPPKRFAQAVGLVFTLAATGFLVAGSRSSPSACSRCCSSSRRWSRSWASAPGVGCSPS